MTFNMTINEFKKVCEALNQEQIDINLLSEVVKEQAQRGGVSPILSQFSIAILSGNNDSIVIEAHRIRASVGFVQSNFSRESRRCMEFIENELEHKQHEKEVSKNV